MKNVAFYPRRLSDNILVIGIVPIDGKPTVASYPMINQDYFFDTYPNDPHQILCTASDHLIEMTLYDTVKNKPYIIQSQPFVGGHVPHKPK